MRSERCVWVCMMCGEREDYVEGREKDVLHCAKCKSRLKLDCTSERWDVRHMFARPGSKRHEDIIVKHLDFMYYHERLSDIELEVWRQHRNSWTPEEIATLMGCDLAKVMECLEVLGIR